MLQRIFDKIDNLDPKLLDEYMSAKELPKSLISRTRLEELNGETLKLKNMGALNKVRASYGHIRMLH